MKKTIAVFISILLVIGGCSPVWAAGKKEVLLPALVTQNDVQKWGYINETGQFVIKPQYDIVKSFTSEGIAIAANTLRGGYVSDICRVVFLDRTGRVASGPYISYVPDFENGYAVIHEEGKGSKLIDEEGKVVLQSKYRLLLVSEGRVSFSEKQSSSERYGFMDMKGNIVLPQKYLQVSAFRDGRAWVKTVEDQFDLIDEKGKVLCTTKYSFYDPKGGYELIPFKDKGTGLYGYKTLGGTIAIDGEYVEAGEFIDGLAVVSVKSGEYDIKTVLINTKNETLIGPDYLGFQRIGKGLYAVAKSGYSSMVDSYLLPNAVFNSEGLQLSGYSYYNVGTFQGDYASACSQNETFFIDRNAKRVESLPKFQGIGSMELIGDIIKAEIDGSLSYYCKDGSLIWTQDTVNTLDGGIQVKRNTFRPDYYNFTEYPQVQGLANLKVQEKINKDLKDIFLGDSEKKEDVSGEEEEYIVTNSTGYTIEKNKDLLIVEMYGYSYPLGAAHGMPSQQYFHVDLKTGVFYNLKDLFKSGAKYADRLTAIVRKQIALNLRIKDSDLSYYYFDEKPSVTDDTGFIVTKDALQVYFTPYEIAAYAAGFVTFDIPYGQLGDIINQNSPFWNSFNKEIKKSKINLTTDIDEKTLVLIQNQMKVYENKIIDAVNSNNFKKVEPVLLKGSSLYTAQKKLVQDLFKKGIKEKLVNYEIYAIGYSYTAKMYKVYVLEDVSIRYPPKKDYVTKKFSWCYTVKVDEKTGNCQLNKIEEW